MIIKFVLIQGTVLPKASAACINVALEHLTGLCTGLLGIMKVRFML
jgi:hypothetical protein